MQVVDIEINSVATAQFYSGKKDNSSLLRMVLCTLRSETAEKRFVSIYLSINISLFNWGWKLEISLES